jgi:hypothetical protein
MKFSERIEVTPVKVEIQIESMDDDLRNSLWNAFQMHCLDVIKPRTNNSIYYSSISLSFFKSLWVDYLKLPLDSLDDSYSYTCKVLQEQFLLKWEWYKVYDFIEFVSYIMVPYGDNFKNDFILYCNSVLERELSAYRFVDGLITQITDESEIREIEEAIQNAGVTKLSGVQTHLKSALAKMSDKKEPDYRNSIKESISAVEAITRILIGDPNATLGNALKKIETEGNIVIHEALKTAFSKLYGWTNDTGIRHALNEELDLQLEDAKYMLVSCSAFINYLIVKADKAGIKL